jgi:hypothetical protein
VHAPGRLCMKRDGGSECEQNASPGAWVCIFTGPCVHVGECLAVERHGAGQPYTLSLK